MVGKGDIPSRHPPPRRAGGWRPPETSQVWAKEDEAVGVGVRGGSQGVAARGVNFVSETVHRPGFHFLSTVML